MRRLSDARIVSARFTAAVAFIMLFVMPGCARNEEPVPKPPAPTASSSVTSSKNTRRSPPLAAPVDSSAQMLPVASRDPDWGLDPSDPAKDYVTRYVRATKRYDAKPCVTVMPSKFTHDKSVVETHNDASGACGKPDELRDRFFVTIATDRMSLDESLHQPKLQNWPDGSDPGGPSGKVADLQDLRAWKAGLRDTFHKLLLAPLRVQLYGRGTYPVISIAGWHGPVLRTMTPAELEEPARTLCEANDGAPLGIFAGVDRATLLRIVCPRSAKFELL